MLQLNVLVQIHIDVQLGLELVIHLLDVHVLEGALLALFGWVVLH